MDKYEKVRVLGKGSFGSAILIKRKTDDALFVVKEIPLGHLNRKERAEARKECSVLQRLQHPNIVQYIEHFENNNCLYLVMEYCDDSDLSKKVKECHGPMKESCILYYFSQVCLAVKYLHSKHILHRDIKTMNVFLMRNGTVKIGDFGIAIMLRNTLAVAKTVCGTPYYFSPELCRNRPYNSKSDMWSLGILLYECATGGCHPFDGSNMSQLMHRIVKTPHKPISDICYSLELRNLVDWCLSKQPTKRPSILQVLAYPLVWKSMESLEEKLLFATSHQLGLQDLLDDTGSSYDITSSHLWLPPPPTFSSDAKSDSINALGEVKNREVRILHPKSVKDVETDLASLPALSIASGVPIPSTLPVVSISTTASPISNDCSELSECSSPVLFYTGVCDTEESNMTEMKVAEMAILRPSSFASDRSKTGNLGPASQTAKPSETNLSSEAPIKKVEKRMPSDQISPFIHTTDEEVVLSDDGSKGRGHDEQELEGGCRLPSASLPREVMEVASEVRKRASNTDAYHVQSKQKQPEEAVHCESDALQKMNDEVEEKERLTFIIRGEKALVMKNIQAKVMCLQELQKNISRAQKVRKRITGKAWRPHPERKKALISHIQSNPPSIPSGVSPCCSLKVDAVCGPPPPRFNSMSKGVVASSLPFPPHFIHDNSSRTNPCYGFNKNSPLFQVEKKKKVELRREGRQSIVPMTGVPAQSTPMPAGTSHSINSAGRRIKWNNSKKAKQAYRSPYAQPFRNPCKDMVGRNAAVSEGRLYACRNREADLHKVLPSSVSYLPIHSRSSFSSSSSLTLSTSTFSSRPPFKAIDAHHPIRFCAPNDAKHHSYLSPLPPRNRWRELQQASSSSSPIESSRSTSQTLRERKAAKEESEREQKDRQISTPPLVETTEHASTPVRKGGRGSSEQSKEMIHLPSRPQRIRVRDPSVTKPNSSVLSSSFIFRPSPTTYPSFPNDHPSTSSLCPITASAVGLGKGVLAHSLAIPEEENKVVLVDESHRSSSAVLSHFSTGTSSTPLNSGHARGTAPTRIRTPPPPPPLCCPSLSPPSPLSPSHPLRAVPIHEGPPPQDVFLPASSSRSFTCPSPPRVFRSPFPFSPSTPFSSQRVLESIQSSRRPRWPLSQASYRPPLPPDLSLRPCPLPRRPLSTPQQRPPSPSQQAVLLSPIPSSSTPCAATLDALKSVVPSSDSLLPEEVLQRDKKIFSLSCETFLHDGPPPAQEDRLRPLPFSPTDPSLPCRRGSPPARYWKGTMERDRLNLCPSLQGKHAMTNVSLSSSQWMDTPTTLETALFLQEKKKTRTKIKKKIRKGKGLVGAEEANSSQWKAEENTVLRVTAPPLPSTVYSPSLALSQGALEGGGGSHFALPSPLHTLSSPSLSHAVEFTSLVECSIDNPTDERGTKKTVGRGMEAERRGEGESTAFHTLDKSRFIPSVEEFHIIDLPSSLTEQKNVESGAGSHQKKQKKKLRDKPMKYPLRHCDFNRHRCEPKQTKSVPYLEQPREKENVGKNKEEIANEVDAELLDVGDVLTYPSPMDKKCICGGGERNGESLDGNVSSACRRHSGRKNSLRQVDWRQWSSTFFSRPPSSSDPAAFFRTTSTVTAPLPSWEKSSEIHLHHVPSVVEEDEENRPTTTNVFSLHIPVTVQDAVHHAKGLLSPRHRFIRSTDLYAGMSRAVPSLAEERYLAEQKKRGAMEQEKLVKDKSEEGGENDSSPNALAFPSVLESLRGTREVSAIKRSLSLSPSLKLLKHRHGCGDIRIHRKSSTSDAITTPRETSSPSIRSAASVSATPSFHSRASNKSSVNRRQAKRVSSTLFRAQTLPTVLSIPSRYVDAPPLPVRPLSLSLNAQCISETTFTSTQESLAEKVVSKTEASNPHSVGSLTPSKEYSEMLRFLKKRLYRRKPRVLGSPGLNYPRKKGHERIGA